MLEGVETFPKGTATSLRKYPDGHDLLQDYVPPMIFKDQKPSKTLRAYDSLGEEIFGVVNRELLEGEADGWRYSVVEQNEGIPAKVVKEKVGKGFADVMYDALQQRLSEDFGLPDFSSDEIENIRQEVHYSYDEQGRPARKMVYQEVDFKDATLFPDKKLFYPVEESEYHYDEQGRIRAKATFSYDDSRGKRLQRATLYDYQPVGENRIRIADISYSNVGWKDLQEGAYPFSVVVKDKDTATRADVAYAPYEDERRVKGEILTNYEFVKKHPRVITYYRQTPKEGMSWKNWQEEPEQVTTASYMTESGFRRFLEGSERTEIGDDPLKENRFEALYFSEFMERVQAASDEEAIQIAADLLSGKIRVPIFSYGSTKGKEETERMLIDFAVKAYYMPDAKKAAVVTHWLPSYARTIRDGYFRDINELSGQITQFAELLVQFPRERRVGFISNYRAAHPNPPEDIALVLDIIENLENYPTLVASEPHRFIGVLEQ